MSEFKREERYIVIKISDLDNAKLECIRTTLQTWQIPTRQCVVVEHDWPIYELVWQMVESLANDKVPINLKVPVANIKHDLTEKYIVTLQRGYTGPNYTTEYLTALRHDPYQKGNSIPHSSSEHLEDAFVFTSISAAEVAAVTVGGEVKRIVQY